jgi:hypothetical protein
MPMHQSALMSTLTIKPAQKICQAIFNFYEREAASIQQGEETHPFGGARPLCNGRRGPPVKMLGRAAGSAQPPRVWKQRNRGRRLPFLQPADTGSPVHTALVVPREPAAFPLKTLSMPWNCAFTPANTLSAPAASTCAVHPLERLFPPPARSIFTAEDPIPPHRRPIHASA